MLSCLCIQRCVLDHTVCGFAFVPSGNDGGDLKEGERSALSNIFEGEFASVPTALGQLTAAFDADLSTGFDQKIAPRLKTGAAEATTACMEKAQQWSGTWHRGGAEGGGLHWATYKACCRREGAWKVRPLDVSAFFLTFFPFDIWSACPFPFAYSLWYALWYGLV